MLLKDSDFRKSAVYFMTAAVFRITGRSFSAFRRIGVQKVIDPILTRIRYLKWRNPWMNFLSAILEFLVAALMLPLESICLLGHLLEAVDERLRANGNRCIDRWVVRYKKNNPANAA